MQQRTCELVALTLIYILAFAIRLHPVLRFETVIHEFDPYFNYRATQYLIDNGMQSFHDWFDPTSWAPFGRVVGATLYPGLMWTAALVHWFLNLAGIVVNARQVCVFLAPWMASNTTVAVYLLGKEIRNSQTGLLAAAFVALVPGYISRSVAGSFDSESVAVFALVLTFFFFIKSVNTGCMFWASMASLAYFCLAASWGGYVFAINMIPLYTVVLVAAGRFSHRLYIAYSVFYVMGTLFSMQIEFIGHQAVQSAEHMAALLTFVGLQLYCGREALKGYLLPASRDVVDFYASMLLLGLTTVATLAVQLTGFVQPWTGRFYSVLDPTYAKEYTPLLASISEHQPCTWASFFFDMHCLVFLFPAGLYYCFKLIKRSDPKSDALVFLVLYGMCAMYFTGVMVRLMIVLAPVSCLLAAVAVSSILSTHLPHMLVTDTPSPSQSPTKKTSFSETQQQLATVMVAGVVVMMFFFVFHCSWVTAETYSSPSIVLSARQTDGSTVQFDDFREAYYWLKMNTESSAKIMSWWDYGYQISALTNRTTIVDNNAWNTTHIATVGKALSANETVAYGIMKRLDVDYVLVIFGGAVGYASDDIDKFLWMVRIGSSVDSTVNEAEYFTKTGDFKVDAQGSPKMLNSLMYKLCYYRFGSVQTEKGAPAGFDRVRRAEIGNKHFELEHLQEAFTSKNWLVRIYKVKPPENRW